MLRAAIHHSLDRIGERALFVESALAALDQCIDRLAASSWPGAVERWSGLNADGFPIELAFSSRDHYVRWTSEAAPPEVPETDRLERASTLLQELGGQSLSPPMHALIARAQAMGSLTWGAAVSGRHGSTGDRYKLYAEVPIASERDAEILPDEELSAARLQRIPRLVMLGWEPLSDGSERWERYYRSESLAEGELSRIMTSVRLAERERELTSAVERAWGGTIDNALAGRWGVSLAGPRNGAVDALSLFKEANHMLGGDSRARAGLLSLVEQLDAGSLDDYARASAPLADHPGTGAHGILSFTVARGRPLELRIGLSPAAVFRAAEAERRALA